MHDAVPRTRETLWLRLAMARDHVQFEAGLRPLAKAQAADASQRAAYGFLGDIEVALVFRAAGSNDVAPATMRDLGDLDLPVERAIALALARFEREHGEPRLIEVEKGLFAMRADKAMEHANALLHEPFWRHTLARMRPGIVVAIPRRDSVLIAGAEDLGATIRLQRLAAKLLRSAGDEAVSAFVYACDDSGWRVQKRLADDAAGADARAASTSATTGTQPLREAAARPHAHAARAIERARVITDDEDDDQNERLDLAARGQRLAIIGIVLVFVLRAVAGEFAMPSFVLYALAIAVAIVGLVGVVRIASGLGMSQGRKLAMMVLAFVPIVNLIALAALSLRATRLLRAAGWRVGLFGARPGATKGHP